MDLNTLVIKQVLNKYSLHQACVEYLSACFCLVGLFFALFSDDREIETQEVAFEHQETFFYCKDDGELEQRDCGVSTMERVNTHLDMILSKQVQITVSATPRGWTRDPFQPQPFCVSSPDQRFGL